MGLPPGWVTGTPGISRPAQLRLLGNGVVPPQATTALRRLAAHGAVLRHPLADH
jgi:DNA (cytosine-5)-methyltransferase 1